MSVAVGMGRSVHSMTELLANHAAAVGEFTERAEAVPTNQWDTPRAPGKWTPAQETKHLVLGYGAFVRDLRGGPTLRLKGRWWQRRIWRWLALPRILASGRFTRAVPAPREVRPPEQPGDQLTLLTELRAEVAAFEAAVQEMHQEHPARRVTHPYFGALTLPELVRLCAVHARHHTAFLPNPDRDRAG